ncbi:hypothetical protein CW745_03655 [Psychromonas sp. psych-6C06]|uniref:hypothetical protein n=1 Tax=Psychromonas sp. psych-6C06 TaxID=2058089 RepID=UPI000C33F40D|nr:hypothetical protein [Psychromonas sp. psych-6C06]PKF62533.1 hypothetical protein CW745_03655 [Psychromonas sp. psych-6C06]
MKSRNINLIRDAACLLEDINIQVSHDLMAMAYNERPSGLFIKKKLDEYKLALDSIDSEQRIKVKGMLSSGELVVIPAGFRCFTKGLLEDELRIKQASLPFDSGFFSPDAIANILENKNIALKYPNEKLNNHQVCMKYENHLHDKHGKGIKFISSSYEEIDKLVSSSNIDTINNYLDSTFGYYTLDVKNRYVLAHYNWHKLATKNKSKGIYDKNLNVKNISDTLNKRLKRMFELCDKAKRIIFVISNTQNYQYMMIDDEFTDLNDIERLTSVTKKLFGSKCIVTNFDEISNFDLLLKKVTF